jgi:hypothetical protein
LPHGDFEDAVEEETGLIPAVVDRSGVSAGPRLRHPRPRMTQARRGQRPLAVLIMLGVAVVIISVVLTVIHTGRRQHPGIPAATGTFQVPAATGPPAADPPADPIAADGCERRRIGNVVSGIDPGGTDSGPDAILAFERAYYVQRSGSAARAVVAADASVRGADEIQRGIDQTPAGTRYCVQVTGAGADHWEVRLTQQKPGESTHMFTQIITTRTDATRTLITSINDAP